MDNAGQPLTIINGIPYGRGREQRFDLYAVNELEKKLPLIIVFPGSWKQVKEKKPYIAVARALVKDNYTVAVAHCPPTEASWPNQLNDARRAVQTIIREAEVLGGDPERIFLVGEGWGAFIATQLILDERHNHWLPENRAHIRGWLTVDALMSEPNLNSLPSGHELRMVFKEQGNWDAVQPLTLLTQGLPPLLAVLSSEANFFTTEAFILEAAKLNNDVNLILRPETASRIWREVGKHQHHIRTLLRPFIIRHS